MDFKDYSIADTTRVFYYSASKQEAINGIERQTMNKNELLDAIKRGEVYSYREEVSSFYFPNKEKQAS